MFSAGSWFGVALSSSPNSLLSVMSSSSYHEAFLLPTQNWPSPRLVLFFFSFLVLVSATGGNCSFAETRLLGLSLLSVILFFFGLFFFFKLALFFSELGQNSDLKLIPNPRLGLARSELGLRPYLDKDPADEMSWNEWAGLWGMSRLEWLAEEG